MQHQRPTPSCARFKSVEIPCAHCRQPMRLAMLEPHNDKLDLLTFSCARCARDEVFLTPAG